MLMWAILNAILACSVASSVDVSITIFLIANAIGWLQQYRKAA